MTPIAKPAARVRNAAATRQDILDAARRLFARESYEQVGLRDIAALVGVDPALVHRYFGGKEALFKLALRGDDRDFVKNVQKQQLVSHLVALVLGESYALCQPEKRPEDPAAAEREAEQLMMLLRSASSARAAAIASAAIQEDLLEPLEAMIDRPNPQIRAVLCLAILLGTALLDSVLSEEQIDRVLLADMLREQMDQVLNG